MMTDRNREAIWAFTLGYMVMAWRVLYWAVDGGVPMPPEAHGDAIHTIPAEAWGVACVAACLAILFTAFFRMFFWLAVASMAMAAVNAYLGVFASAATYGFLVSGGAWLFAALFACITLAALRDWGAWFVAYVEGRVDE